MQDGKLDQTLLKFESEQFSKMKKEIKKKYFVSEIIASDLASLNCAY